MELEYDHPVGDLITGGSEDFRCTDVHFHLRVREQVFSGIPDATFHSILKFDREAPS